MTDFHLCPNGRRLYSAWSQSEEIHAKDRNQRKREYLAHKADCMDCTDWQAMRRAIDEIAGRA